MVAALFAALACHCLSLPARGTTPSTTCPFHRNMSAAEFHGLTAYTRNRRGPQAEGFNASLWDVRYTEDTRRRERAEVVLT